MNVEEALEVAEDPDGYQPGDVREAFSIIADEVTRLNAHILRASRRTLEHGFADELTEFCAGLDVTELPPGVYDKLFMAKEHIKGLERMVAFGEHRVRDTRKGEWPEDRSPILRWSTTVSRWVPDIADDRYRETGMLWLPAPPPPADD